MTARFFSEMNEVPGQARGGRVETPAGWFDAPGVADGPAIACLRPQSLRIRPAGHCLPARIQRRLFLGEVDLVELIIPGVDRPLKARPREHVPYRPGEEVGLDIDTAEVLVFAASGA
jgi:iron(III) transport system ATP-binding protein